MYVPSMRYAEDERLCAVDTLYWRHEDCCVYAICILYVRVCFPELTGLNVPQPLPAGQPFPNPQGGLCSEVNFCGAIPPEFNPLCHCDDLCTSYGDCCEDYTSFCDGFQPLVSCAEADACDQIIFNLDC
eukprot:scaffold1781_cov416-Prasinococcus_capsulatus_cf.AAC.18